MLTIAPVVPIDPQQLTIFFLQCGVLLLLAASLGALAARFGMPALVGELVAGALLGPSLLATVAPGFAAWLIPQRADQFHLLDAVGQVSVVLLVGITGVQIDLGLVRRRGATAARVSIASLVIPLGLGVAAGLLVPAAIANARGGRPVFAFALGVALCVSALPVIAKILTDMDLLHRNVGQLTIAAGVVDDVIGWLLLSIVSAVATTGIDPGRIGLSVAYMAGMLVFAALIGRPVVSALLRLAARAPGPGLTTAVVVAMLLLSGAAMQALGFEAVLGSFICGILIGSSDAFEPARLFPLRGAVLWALAPLYFATVGLRMDLTALARPEVLVAAIVILAVAIVGKFAGAVLGAAMSRLNPWETLALAAGINARGVIQVIVASVGLRLGVFNPEAYTIIILVAIATSLMAPPLLRWAMGHVDYSSEEHARAERHGALSA
jgi:Kef-type K+ transport system membrane component KefB